MTISPTDLSDRQLMAVQIQTLYQCDRNNRLAAVNEPEPADDRSPTPRFFMGRTLNGNHWRLRHDLPRETITQLEQLCQAEPTITDFGQPPQHYAAIKAVLAGDAPITSEYRGPAYWIPNTVQPSGQAILITAANAELVDRHYSWLVEPIFYPDVGPVAAVVQQGKAVAVCFCSRVPGQATEAGVETHPDFRGRGYAPAAVACWAAAVRQQGCLPLYSTSWENHASQAVARKLGMMIYGEDWSLL